MSLNKEKQLNNEKNGKASERIKRASAVLILLAIWQIIAMVMDRSLLLPSPIGVVGKFFTLAATSEFWKSIGFSFIRIAGGFLLGFIIGVLLAALAGRFKYAEILLRPLMLTIKSVPVASFIIIALIWISSSQLSIFISFLMVLPVIYNNVLAGIKATDIKMQEMGKIFRFNTKKRIKYIWVPSIKTQLISAVSTALGLSWKAGIAAEVIGIPAGSLGEMLYMAKVHFETNDLLAWTVAIVLLSLGFEKLCTYLIKLFYKKMES